jgi:hypothetical protein
LSVEFPKDTDTSPDWPEWTWGEFNAYWSENLAPITPIPGHLTQRRDATILEAWQHFKSASGFYLAFNDRLRRLVDRDAYFAARSAMDGYNQDLTTNGITPEQDPNMAALIVPDCFLVAINGVSGGQVVTNVVGVRNAGGTAAGAAGAVRTAFKVASGPLSQRAGQYALTDFRAMDLSTADGAIATITDTTAGGLAPTTQLATNAASALIKFNGGSRSGSSRGRLYHGPLNESNINADGRTLLASFLTSLQTAYDAFSASLASAGYPLVVISRKNSTSKTVSTLSVANVIATQRRRIR